MTHRRATLTALSLLTVVGLGLTACSSSTARTAGTTPTTDTVVETTEASPETTDAPAKATTTAAPTTTAPVTTLPQAQALPSVNNISAAKTTWTCAEVTDLGGSIPVSWSTSGAASVIIGIDSPDKYDDGAASGTIQIPAPCDGGTQVVYITPVDNKGNKGKTKSITLRIGTA